MKEFQNPSAQGDLYIRRVDKLPSCVAPAAAVNGAFILAHSETGHHHVIAESPTVRVHDTADPLLSYLEVIEATDAAEALIEHLRGHDTHETLRIPPGIYELRRQRESAPEGWRRAAD